MKAFELRASLTKILQKLDIIDAKVSATPQVQVNVSVRFLPTLNALRSLGRPAEASEIAGVTGRARAAESKILNELFTCGVLIKEKSGRKRLFSLKANAENRRGVGVEKH